MLDNDSTGAQTEHHQTQMMSEINKLTAGSDGRLDKADYERTVKTLLTGGSDPVISKEPDRRLHLRRHRQGRPQVTARSSETSRGSHQDIGAAPRGRRIFSPRASRGRLIFDAIAR